MKRYLVCSNEYEVNGVYLDPPEYVRDVVEVEAKNKREAKVVGLARIRAEFPYGWNSYCHGPGAENPFKGLTVEEM